MMAQAHELHVNIIVAIIVPVNIFMADVFYHRFKMPFAPKDVV
jgi:hypothetical protein